VPITDRDIRVVELRVHGISGASAESLVDAVAAVDVAGDGTGRIVRPADQLRRPAPGPPVPAGQPVPRTVEGYIWGAMTSGGWAKATWALLFPFALANVAHWTLPPLASDSALARTFGVLLRALLRVSALLLTCLLVAQLTLLSLDLLAAQCLAPGTGCLAAVPQWARELPLLRAVAGLLPVAVLITVMHRVSCTDWTAPAVAPGSQVGGPAGDVPTLPATPLVGDPDTPSLRVLHTVAGLAVAALLAAGGPQGPGPGLGVPWWAALGLLAFAMAGAVLLDDPTGSSADRAGDGLRMALERWPRKPLLAAGAAVLAATAVLVRLPAAPQVLPGSDATVQTIAALLSLCCGAVGVLLVPAARLSRRCWAGLPPKLRPWAGGWAAAPVLALAMLVGGGFGAGLALSVRRVLGHPELRLPPAYSAVTLVWGASGLVLAGCAAAVATVLVLRGWRLNRGRASVPPEVELLHERHEHAMVAAAWWRAELVRGHVHHAVLTAAGVLTAATGVMWALRLSGVEPPPWTEPVSTLGVTVLAALAGALLTTVYRAARQPEAGRRLGVLWDLASFWPREAHPTVPPCYPLKVIPELVGRTIEHLRDPGTRVVLSGLSHGGLIATIAVARVLAALPPADRERVGLVTAGSHVQWAYQRGFPAVLPHECLCDLAEALGGRWRALCRGTDPLGGAVTTWSRRALDGRLTGLGFRPDGTHGPLPQATQATAGARGVLILGGDHWLPDPMRPPDPEPNRRWRSGVLGHRDYLADPEWDRAVALAAGLTHSPATRGTEAVTATSP
jgi:hypothetical protein